MKSVIIENKNYNISNLLSDFKVYLGSNSSENTIKAYMSDLNRFMDIINGKELTHDVIQEYCNSLSENGKSTRTVKRNMETIKKFTKMLQKEKIITTNMGLDIETKSIVKKPISSFKFEDYKRILELIELKESNKGRRLRWRSVFRLSGNTGMRISEILNLQISDVSEKFLYIRNAKGNKERYVPIDEETSIALHEYIDYITDGNKKDYKSIDINDNKVYNFTYNTCVKKLTQYCRILDIDYTQNTWHTLRHMRANVMRKKGVPLEIISETLGNTVQVLSENYLHIEKEEMYEMCCG